MAARTAVHKGEESMNPITNFVKLYSKRIKRLPMNLMIRNLVRWEKQGPPEPGYSVVIACMRELAPVAIANLRLCALLNNSRLHELLLVFDCPTEQIPQSVRDAVKETSSSVSVQLIGYTDQQHQVAKRINWGWVYAWLSWSLALGQIKTRGAIIHDLDAMPLSPNIFDEIFDHWAQHGAEFCGIRPYSGSGVEDYMGLVRTFELALDVAFVRRTFQPFDLFNKLKIVDGRVIDFDTMLDAQRLSPRRVVEPIEEAQLVHPSQLICHYTNLVSGRTDFRDQQHMLPVLAYFMYLGGDPDPLTAATPHIADIHSEKMPFFGKTAFINGILPQGWAWMEKQIRRMEQHCFGETRQPIGAFLEGMASRAGTHRTVGKEAGEFAVPER